jgi:thymidylate synthase
MSNDLFLGNPYNIAQYAALTHVIAQLTSHLPGDLVVTIGDAHIYSNHVEQVKLQLTRKFYKLPTLEVNPKLSSIDDLCYEDFQLHNYESHPAIKGDVAI